MTRSSSVRTFLVCTCTVVETIMFCNSIWNKKEPSAAHLGHIRKKYMYFSQAK